MNREVTAINRLSDSIIDDANLEVKRVPIVTPQIGVIPSRGVASLKPYETVKQDALFTSDPDALSKLDWNESTIAPPQEIIDAIVAEINRGILHWYPDVNSERLIEALSKYTGLNSSCIQTFSGSDAALEYVCRTFLDADDEALIVGPTYDNFRIYAESVGARTFMSLGESPFASDMDSIIAAITPRTKLIYIVSPNNPTGVIYTEHDIRHILESAPNALLVLDEAYFEFCNSTCVQLVMSYPNLLIARSFSKAFGLASIRCGYLLSDPMNIGYINRIRVGKNLTAVAQAGALAALNNPKYMYDYVQTVKENSAFLTTKLRDLGLTVHATPANFVMVKVAKPTEVCAFLANENIYVRNRTHLPQLDGYIRITVGTDKFSRRILDAFSRIPREQLADNQSSTTNANWKIELNRGAEPEVTF